MLPVHRAQLVQDPSVRVVEALNDRGRYMHVVAKTRDLADQPVQRLADISQVDHGFVARLAHVPISVVVIVNIGPLQAWAKRGMLAGDRDPFGKEPPIMPTAIRENHAKRMLKNDELVLCFGVNQLRTPNIAMIETPEAVANIDEIAAVEGIGVVHIGASGLSTEMGVPGQYTHERMRAAFETVGDAARQHGKAMGVGGVRQDFEFQSWPVKIGRRCLTGGCDVGYILSAGRADVKQLRGLSLS
jgi:hypothetical protein